MPDTHATDGDERRQATTDRDYVMPIEEVAERYQAAGHPRTIRTLQRYCASGHLDCQKVQTTLGDKYFVAAYSVARHIAQINEIIAYSPVATGRDMSRQAATDVAHQPSHFKAAESATGNDEQRQATTGATAQPQEIPSDKPRQAATETEAVSPSVAAGRAADDVRAALDAAAARNIERLEDENDFLREQINRKDKTIDSLIERDRETNILVRGLQQMLTPLLGPRRDYRDPSFRDSSEPMESN